MPALHRHMDKGHHAKAQRRRVQPRLIALDQPGLFQAAVAPQSLRRRQRDGLCQFQVGGPPLLLQHPQQAAIGTVQLDRLHFDFLISEIHAIRFHNLGFPCLFYEIQFCRQEYTLHPKQAHFRPVLQQVSAEPTDIGATSLPSAAATILFPAPLVRKPWPTCLTTRCS
ncbi:hypothetical protein CNECB9_4870035 [Cupriavidus necator]|uniref:Uncharacterized protein n=1 Tax=Cupriavidus necator TaxID=106590 RepID=A0A1K0JHH1_CUPNE|nr:hypothetical protein CNECB9_4870035 [Cupriavidus necator]